MLDFNSSVTLYGAMVERDEALQTVLEAIKPGALAAGLRIRAQAISQWERVPYRRVLDVERLSGVPRHVQRPDIYPPPVNEPCTPSSDDSSAHVAGSSHGPNPEISTAPVRAGDGVAVPRAQRATG